MGTSTDIMVLGSLYNCCIREPQTTRLSYSMGIAKGNIGVMEGLRRVCKGSDSALIVESLKLRKASKRQNSWVFVSHLGQPIFFWTGSYKGGIEIPKKAARTTSLAFLGF